MPPVRFPQGMWCYKGQESEQIEMLNMLYNWTQSGNRNLMLAGGDVHLGGLTEIYRHGAYWSKELTVGLWGRAVQGCCGGAVCGWCGGHPTPGAGGGSQRRGHSAAYRGHRAGAHASRVNHGSHATRNQQGTCPAHAPPAEWGSVRGGRPGHRVEEQGTWASGTRKRSEAGCGRPEDGGVGTAKTVKRPGNNQHNPETPPTGRR